MRKIAKDLEGEEKTNKKKKIELKDRKRSEMLMQ